MTPAPEMPVTTATKKYLLRSEAADYCIAQGAPIARATLAKLACLGEGPDYRQFGNKTLYTTEDLDRWIEGRMGGPKATATQHQQHQQHQTAAE